MAEALRIADAFPAVEGGGYHRHLAELRNYQASGLYAIVGPRGAILYIGESHTGRLYDTITRHFRDWRIEPGTDAQGRRRGGTTYNRDQVRVIYLICNADEAQQRQYEAIQRLGPRDNIIDGSAAGDGIPI